MNRELKDITNLRYYEVSKENPLEMKLGKSTREKLYHYTTKVGKEGILGSNIFWVTHSNFLDDKSEIKYMSVVLQGVIIYLYQNEKLYDLGIEGQYYIYDAVIKSLESLMKIYQYGAPITGGNIFLLSLTENENNKFLIENYCCEDGYIIELENNISLMFKDNEHLYPAFSAKVEYDLSRQMTLLLEDINEFYSELLTNMLEKKKVDYMEMVETIKSILYIKIINYSFFFKHYSFAEEEEYRVVFLVDNKYEQFIKYRLKSDHEIPYIEAKFNKKCLLNVVTPTL